jgi:hypothetical protein
MAGKPFVFNIGQSAIHRLFNPAPAEAKLTADYRSLKAFYLP